MTDGPVQPFPLQTASGLEVWYLDPWKTPIDASDMKIALGRMRRYAGAADVTVLQHLALCVELGRAAGLTPILLAFVAAHDLHEAYVLDIPAPLKPLLAGYAAIEERWAERVHAALGLGWPVHPKIAERVRAIDLRALVVETTWTGHAARARVEEMHGGPVTAAEMEIAARCLRPTQGTAPLWDIVVKAIRAGGGEL